MTKISFMSWLRMRKKLLDIEECTSIADIGYYNVTEIKNCIDDGMAVYIKKSKTNNSKKNNEFRKE